MSEEKMRVVPHDYVASTVGHGETQCRWCLGTNRENAFIAPNHCSDRAERDPAFSATPPDISALVSALGKAVETLAAGRHLIGKYTPDHHWLGEHDARIEELKAIVQAHKAGGAS